MSTTKSFIMNMCDIGVIVSEARGVVIIVDVIIGEARGFDQYTGHKKQNMWHKWQILFSILMSVLRTMGLHKS